MNKIIISIAFLCFTSLSFAHSEKKQYEISISENGYGTNTWSAIRYEVNSGRSWISLKGTMTEIKEEKPLKKSIYKVESIATRNGWGSFRIDTKTGASWYYKDKSWVKYLEVSDKK